MINIISLLVGVVCGVIFSLLKLPIPAPNCLAGVLGIVGVYLGLIIVTYFKGN